MLNLILAIVFIAVGLWCSWAQAKVYETQDQALHNAFPEQQVGRKTLFLTQEQADRIEKLARAKVDSHIVTYYVARDSSGVTGIAFFDRQTVRTLPITYSVVVKPSGKIDRVEILSFDEPDDYFPPLRWLRLYRNRALNNDLNIGRAIPHITGASLTSQAVNDGVRRALATFEICVKGTL